MIQAEQLFEKLLSKELKIAAAESCTGGAFMASLVRIPGASKIFGGGMVAYGNDEKIGALGVEKGSIEKFGVVSEQVAKEMAVCARRKFGADVGVGVTGFAGPSGEYVGWVCFGLNVGSWEFSVTKNFEGMSRGEVIDASVSFLLEWLCEKI